MKNFINWFKGLPMPIAFVIFFGIPWGSAFLILRLFDTTPGTNDTWVDYVASGLIAAPLLYLLIAQVIGPLLKRNK
jgi:hypothetical protein